MIKRYVIERDMPSVGSTAREQFRAAAQKSNDVLTQLGTDIQWVQSFVAADTIYCVYLAMGEDLIRKHAEMSGFPASSISEIKRIIDPTSANAA